MSVNNSVVNATNVSSNYGDTDITVKIIEEILSKFEVSFFSLCFVLIVIVCLAHNQPARSWVHTTLVKSLATVYTALVKRRCGSQETRGSSQADSV